MVSRHAARSKIRWSSGSRHAGAPVMGVSGECANDILERPESRLDVPVRHRASSCPPRNARACSTAARNPRDGPTRRLSVDRQSSPALSDQPIRIHPSCPLPVVGKTNRFTLLGVEGRPSKNRSPEATRPGAQEGCGHAFRSLSFSRPAPFPFVDASDGGRAAKPGQPARRSPRPDCPAREALSRCPR